MYSNCNNNLLSMTVLLYSNAPILKYSSNLIPVYSIVHFYCINYNITCLGSVFDFKNTLKVLYHLQILLAWQVTCWTTITFVPYRIFKHFRFFILFLWIVYLSNCKIFSFIVQTKCFWNVTNFFSWTFDGCQRFLWIQLVHSWNYTTILSLLSACLLINPSP